MFRLPPGEMIDPPMLQQNDGGLTGCRSARHALIEARDSKQVDDESAVERDFVRACELAQIDRARETDGRGLTTELAISRENFIVPGTGIDPVMRVAGDGAAVGLTG
jgi:hypothetical protein